MAASTVVNVMMVGNPKPIFNQMIPGCDSIPCIYSKGEALMLEGKGTFKIVESYMIEDFKHLELYILNVYVKSFPNT